MIGRQRRAAAATRAQTALYAGHAGELAAQLRREISVPPRPHGQPALVVMMGVPGAGKTHVARLLAGRLGAAHVATDELRHRLFVAATYTDRENEAVFEAAAALLERLLEEGQRVVLDATNLRRRDRAPALAVAERHGVPTVFVRVVAEEAEILARLAVRRSARTPGDHSDADERVYERMRAREFEPPAEGHLEIRNGPRLEDEVARVVEVVERSCSRRT